MNTAPTWPTPRTFTLVMMITLASRSQSGGGRDRGGGGGGRDGAPVCPGPARPSPRVGLMKRAVVRTVDRRATLSTCRGLFRLQRTPHAPRAVLGPRTSLASCMGEPSNRRRLSQVKRSILLNTPPPHHPPIPSAQLE